ncbi:hypothetical protein F5X99DRAFT_407492 [Biscogniauxia marginata]|nr:hypothetical protein F5X99DRAFT_407492 [Biscogniauxia marginata]
MASGGRLDLVAVVAMSSLDPVQLSWRASDRVASSNDAGKEDRDRDGDGDGARVDRSTRRRVASVRIAIGTVYFPVSLFPLALALDASLAGRWTDESWMEERGVGADKESDALDVGRVIGLSVCSLLLLE